MNTGRVIRKIAFIGMWLVIGGGMVILLAAAMRKQNNDHCSGYQIIVKGDRANLFVDEKDVEKLIMSVTRGNIKGEALASFDLHKLEAILKDNSWIDEADLYFDNHDVLHISVTEKIPVARIFTVLGNSFYLDAVGNRMPLSPKMSARVPVFTGFPGRKILSSRDSLLVKQVATTARFILDDPFWMAQVSQIDISPERNFEMIPTVGNHIVKLGNGEQMDKKFHRLFLFYQQVLSQTGFEKYRVIDVQYAGQVVASNQPVNMKVDSIQLRKNVEKLLQQAREAQKDPVSLTKPVTEKPIIQADLTTAPKTISKPEGDKDGIKPRDPNPVKSFLKTDEENKNVQPKAVMPKRDGN